MKFLLTVLLVAMSAVTARGQILTLAGPPLPVSGLPVSMQTIDSLGGVVADPKGGWYVSSFSHHRVYRISADGILTVIAGKGTYGFGGDGGPAVDARLAHPLAMVLDTSGNLYIADTENYRVRKVAPNGTISTVAGAGSPGSGGDGGPATGAQLCPPTSLVLDSVGDLLIGTYCAGGVKTGGVRKIARDGTISTVSTRYGAIALDRQGRLLIGYNGVVRIEADGTATTIIQFSSAGPFSDCKIFGVGVCAVSSLVFDASDNLWIAEAPTNRLLRVSADGKFSEVGSFFGPWGLAVDDAGNVLVAEAYNNAVRRISPDGQTSTAFGGLIKFDGDGGRATAAHLNEPSKVVLAGDGSLYVADSGNNRVRKISPTGTITTVAGTGVAGFSGDGGPATSAQLNYPYALALDSDGDLYICDASNYSVRMVTPDGRIQTVAGIGVGLALGSSSPESGPAKFISLDGPLDIALDGSGILYIFDRFKIKKVANGFLTTILTTSYSGIAYRFAADKKGNVFVVFRNEIRQILPNGQTITVLTASTDLSNRLINLRGFAVDSQTNFYFSTELYNQILKVSPAGDVQVVAGVPLLVGFSGDGDLPTLAGLYRPDGLVVDDFGHLYVADSRNNRVRWIPVPKSNRTYEIPPFGFNSWSTYSSPSSSPKVEVGYGVIKRDAGVAPSGVAVLSNRQNGVLIGEASVPASPLVKSGRVAVQPGASIRTGLAIANPNPDPAAISFYFTDDGGKQIGAGSTVLSAGAQTSAFLDEAPFRGTAAARTFTFTSNTTVAVTVLRGRINERGDFLMTTLPVASLDAPSTPGLVIPQFAAGGGWTTEIQLVNPTDSPITGVVNAGEDTAYTIAPRSSLSILRTGDDSATRTGTVLILPASSNAAPRAAAVLTFVSRGIVVTETGVAAQSTDQAFQVFAEANAARSLQTGLAVANVGASPALVTLQLADSSGRPVGSASTMTLPGYGHTSMFLRELPGFQNLPASFRGVLQVSTNSAGAALSVVGLRGQVNERGDFLVSTTPANPNSRPPDSTDYLFAQVASGDGYTTEFILLPQNAMALTFSTSRGQVLLFKQSGVPWELILTP